MTAYDRQSIENQARDAILLLLYLGQNSYCDDPGKGLVYSPLAGQTLNVEDLDIKSTGPTKGEGNFHVVISFRANGRRVEAYCTVSRDCQKIFLISNTTIYVGDVQLSQRNISVRRGSIEPWGMDKEYNLQHAISASAYQG